MVRSTSQWRRIDVNLLSVGSISSHVCASKQSKEKVVEFIIFDIQRNDRTGRTCRDSVAKWRWGCDYHHDCDLSVLAICSSSRVVLGLLHQTHSMWTLPWSSTNCLPIGHTRIYPASRTSRMSKRSDNNSALWFLERMYASIVITSILISSWEHDRLWLCAEWTQVNDAFWMLETNCLQILESHRDSTIRSESRRWYLSLLSGNCFNFSLAVIFLTGEWSTVYNARSLGGRITLLFPSERFVGPEAKTSSFRTMTDMTSSHSICPSVSPQQCSCVLVERYCPECQSTDSPGRHMNEMPATQFRKLASVTASPENHRSHHRICLRLSWWRLRGFWFDLLDQVDARSRQIWSRWCQQRWFLMRMKLWDLVSGLPISVNENYSNQASPRTSHRCAQAWHLDTARPQAEVGFHNLQQEES